MEYFDVVVRTGTGVLLLLQKTENALISMGMTDKGISKLTFIGIPVTVVLANS